MALCHVVDRINVLLLCYSCTFVSLGRKLARKYETEGTHHEIEKEGDQLFVECEHTPTFVVVRT